MSLNSVIEKIFSNIELQKLNKVVTMTTMLERCSFLIIRIIHSGIKT